MGKPQAIGREFPVCLDFRPRAWRARDASASEGACSVAAASVVLGPSRSRHRYLFLGRNSDKLETAPGAGFKPIPNDEPRSGSVADDNLRRVAGINTDRWPRGW